MQLLHAVLLVTASCIGIAESASKHWAVLVAGSNTWDNYRHQADVCHAYQILIKNGIPAEQIITFMYDDLAQNSQNPTKGIVINKPNGPDVYKGVKIDYKGADVTVPNFLNAITGVKKGSKKVLESGADDHVFINLVDHGAPGIFAFPTGELTSKQLIDAINTMSTKKMFGQLVVYLEACESGSMFDGLLPRNASVFATTASGPDESSYACYYDEKRETYLGDVYSVNWMEDSDKGKMTTETLAQQYTIVKKLTNTSKVMEYGKLDIAKQVIGQFQGNTPTDTEYEATPRVPITDAVRSEDVDLAILRRRFDAAVQSNDQLTASTLEVQIARLKHDRAVIDDTYMRILQRVTGSESAAERIFADVNVYNDKIDWGCYEPLIYALKRSCFPQLAQTFAARRLYTMVTVCRFGYASNEIIAAISEVCSQAPVDNRHL